MEYMVSENKIWIENEQGKVVAEILFPTAEDGIVNITHTWADPSLRGQGIAGRITRMAADLFREKNMKCVPTCSYAVRWFREHPEYSDVLKDGRKQ